MGLGGTRVTDAGLAAFSASTTLWDLNLDDTQVTDAGLAVLPTYLAYLSLMRTKITEAGADQFRKASPRKAWVYTDASPDTQP